MQWAKKTVLRVGAAEWTMVPNGREGLAGNNEALLAYPEGWRALSRE